MTEDDLDDLVSSVCYSMQQHVEVDWPAVRAELAAFEGMDTDSAWSVIEHCATDFGVTIPPA